MNGRQIGAVLAAGVLWLGPGAGRAQPHQPLNPEASPAGSPFLVPSQLGSVSDQAVLERVCGGCHAKADLTDTGRSPQAWSDLVDRMGGYGLAATPEEINQIKAYLARIAPETPSPPSRAP